MVKPFRKTICLDFDGVLHSYSAAWRGPSVIPDPPVPGAMEFLRGLALSQQFTPAIYSSRSSSLAGRRAMKRWVTHWLSALEIGTWGHLDAHSPTLWVAKETVGLISSYIQWPWFKPSAWLTIDDRAMQFTGAFPSFPEMLAFQPWNKRKPLDDKSTGATFSRDIPGLIPAKHPAERAGQYSEWD